MRVYDGKQYRDLTAEEIAEREAQAQIAEAQYWASISYEEAVSAKFRERYSQDRTEAIINNFLLDPTNSLFVQEMMEMQNYRAWCKIFVKCMLSQNDTREYDEYIAYCEECKTFVKEKKSIAL